MHWNGEHVTDFSQRGYMVLRVRHNGCLLLKARFNGYFVCMYLNYMVYKMIVLLRSYHQRCRTTHHGYLRVTAEPPQYQLQANTKLPLSHLRTTSEPPHTYLRSIAELPQNHRRTTSEHKRATDEPRGRATSKPPLELLFSLNSVVM